MTEAARRAVVVCALVVATIALPARTASAFIARPCAGSAAHVAVVVDTGSGVSAACVPLQPGDNGLSVLVRRASMLGTPAPRINGDGFLCAIDGVPDTGCGEDAGATSYWSYWHGDGSWSYESLGAGSTRPDAGVVEGWRFASTSGAKPEPRGSASATAICAPAPPPPVPPPAVQSLGNPPAPVARGNANGTSSVGASPTTAPIARSASTTAGSRPRTSSSSSTPSSALTGNEPVAARHSSGGSAPVGVFVGLALVAALATAGVFVARRRKPATP